MLRRLFGCGRVEMIASFGLAQRPVVMFVVLIDVMNSG